MVLAGASLVLYGAASYKHILPGKARTIRKNCLFIANVNKIYPKVSVC